ncbi:hypothetical protein [Azospirillum sp. BE72]|uniref:hypothetical protein n=1 Tax=Azospirillum sp. BE72 TaxID=2817776 RepID=UPI00285879F1|nr:hypothetical protein [Azospirillum sp. BE72]MDR6772062.1 hypothetical protein [Azospirillum sp. BE72]
MEIRGVSSTTAVRPTAFQPTEGGVAASSADSVQPSPTQTDGTATGTETGKSSGPGYISPYLRYDQGARVAVLYFRDFDTGETQDQIPSQRVVEEYRRAADRLAQDDQRKSAGTQTASGGKAETAAGSTDGSARTASGAGSATTRSTDGSGSGATSLGVSFASATGRPTASASGSGIPTGTAPAAGFAPAPAAGNYGGSPGGLVSVTV